MIKRALQWLLGVRPPNVAALRHKFLQKYPLHKHSTYDMRPIVCPIMHAIEPLAYGFFAVWSCPAVQPGDRVRTERGLFGVVAVHAWTATASRPGSTVATFLCLDNPGFYEVEGREYARFEEGACGAAE